MNGWRAISLRINREDVAAIMLPRVILHNAISLDGQIEGFFVDLQQYYGLAAAFREDATLAGADTFLRAENQIPPEDQTAFLPPRMDPGDSRPLLVVPDSRGRIRSWHYLKSLPYWRDCIALCSRTTSQEYLQYLGKRHIHFIIAGEDHVDLREALERLASDYGVRVVRVDAGGTLNGILLSEGLVDEVSVLVCPFLVGSPLPGSVFRLGELPGQGGLSWQAENLPSGKFLPTERASQSVEREPIPLMLTQVERMQGDVMRLRYDLTSKAQKKS